MQNASAKIYKWVDDKGRVQFSDRPPVAINDNSRKKIREPLTKRVSNKASSDHVFQGSGSNIKVIPQAYKKGAVLKLRGLLKLNKYIELNEILLEYQDAYKRSYNAENRLFWAYDAFESKDPKFERYLNDWIKASPGSYQPYLARAKYYYRQGWLIRGHKWSSETKEHQKEGMLVFFDKAKADIKSALKKNKHLVVAYHLLIGISNTGGDSLEKVTKVANNAIKTDPYSFYLRAMYLHALTPRWGGSYEKMQEFIDESLVYVDKNANLSLLQGHIYADAAEQLNIVNKYSTAEEMYTEALSFGDDHLFLKNRAVNRFESEDYHGALKDLNRAIKIHPEKTRYYYWKSRAYSALEQYKKATRALLKANALEPVDSYNIKQTEWLSNKLTSLGYELNRKQKYKEALKRFDTALLISPDNGDIFLRKTRSFINLNKLNLALKSIKKSINLEPGIFDAYIMIDWLLTRKKDWSQIIKYWDQYLLIHPEDGRAYLERGGTYYHKGDMEMALENAKKSADLGNVQGKEMYDKFKRIVK
jgi:tetratricopeptide (TPR) repeat protein